MNVASAGFTFTMVGKGSVNASRMAGKTCYP